MSAKVRGSFVPIWLAQRWVAMVELARLRYSIYVFRFLTALPCWMRSAERGSIPLVPFHPIGSGSGLEIMKIMTTHETRGTHENVIGMQGCLQLRSSVDFSANRVTHHITSHHITSHHITSHYITSHHITLEEKIVISCGFGAGLGIFRVLVFVLVLVWGLALCEGSDLRVPRAVTRLTVYRPLGILLSTLKSA